MPARHKGPLSHKYVTCSVCGKDAALYADGYMFVHGRTEDIPRSDPRFVPESRVQFRYPPRWFAECPGVIAWNETRKRHAMSGFDPSLPRYIVWDTVHRCVGMSGRGRRWAERIAEEWNAREGAWNFKRFTVKRGRVWKPRETCL